MDTSTARRDNPFHDGEQAVHEPLGMRERMLGLGQRVIRTAMPVQHQRFFEQLPFMLTGSVDGAGGDELKAFDAAERAWRFRMDAGWRLRDALPLRWAFRDFSPHSTLTGT